MAAIAGSRFGIARQSRSMARSLPWLVVCAWLMCQSFGSRGRRNETLLGNFTHWALVFWALR